MQSCIQYWYICINELTSLTLDQVCFTVNRAFSNKHTVKRQAIPDSKVHGAKMGPPRPRWAPCGSHENRYLGLHETILIPWSFGINICDIKPKYNIFLSRKWGRKCSMQIFGHVSSARDILCYKGAGIQPRFPEMTNRICPNHAKMRSFTVRTQCYIEYIIHCRKCESGEVMDNRDI